MIHEDMAYLLKVLYWTELIHIWIIGLLASCPTCIVQYKISKSTLIQPNDKWLYIFRFFIRNIFKLKWECEKFAKARNKYNNIFYSFHVHVFLFDFSWNSTLKAFRTVNVRVFLFQIRFYDGFVIRFYFFQILFFVFYLK